MREKGFSYIIILVLVTILLGIGAFYTLNKKPLSPTNINQEQNSNREITWESDVLTYSDSTYGFEFKYPSDWSIYDESKDTNSAKRVQLFPVKQGQPTGDAFFSSISVTENITDFDNWFRENKDFTQEKQNDYISLVNETFDQEYLKTSDINVSTKKLMMGTYPIWQQIVETTCPDSTTCHMLGWPAGYEKRVVIYNAERKMVIEFFVVTYSRYEDTEIFDQVINSLKFI